MPDPSRALDELQSQVDAVIREHNATADPRKMHIIWGHRDKEAERLWKRYEGTEHEDRDALLNFDDEDFEIILCLGRPDRPGWLTITKSTWETFYPCPTTRRPSSMSSAASVPPR
jgi:hypothetical protein